MWFPRILSNLNLSLLPVTYRVAALDSGSFLLCPVRKPENDPAWLEASSVPLSIQGQPSIPSERPWACWVTPCFQVHCHLRSLFLVAADAELFHPALGVSGGKEQKKMKALFCPWLDICISELPCCVDDATTGAVLLNVNFVHRLDFKIGFGSLWNPNGQTTFF